MRPMILAAVLSLLCACSERPVVQEHLMVKVTHQDLGQWIKGTIAYNEVLKGTVDYSIVPNVYFQTGSTDCTLALSVVDLGAYDSDQDYYVNARGFVMAPFFKYGKLSVEDSFDYTAILDPGLELPLCNQTPHRMAPGFYYHFVTNVDGYLAKLQTYRSDELEVKEIVVR